MGFECRTPTNALVINELLRSDDDKGGGMAAQVAENNNIQAKLGDLTISSVEDVGGKRGFVEDEGEQFLFDSGLITALDVKVKNGRTPANPGEGLRMRALGSGDFKRGFLVCLAELTKVGDV